MRKSAFAVVVLGLALGGCNAAREVVDKPGDITLRDALLETVDALNDAYSEARIDGRHPVGYYPCTLEADFNISATGTATNTFNVGASGGVKGLALNASDNNVSTLTATRGNVVKAVFISSLCIPSTDQKAADGSTPAGGGGRGSTPTPAPGANHGGRQTPTGPGRPPFGLPTPPVLFDYKQPAFLPPDAGK